MVTRNTEEAENLHTPLTDINRGVSFTFLLRKISREFYGK